MSPENQDSKPKELDEKKIHQTHFSVKAIEFVNPDSDETNEYEWVSSGTGRVKRVPKKSSNSPKVK